MWVKLWQVFTLLLACLVTGVFWGPWVALHRTANRLTAPVLLEVVHQLSPNLAQVMTPLMPGLLLCLLPDLWVHRTQGGPLGLLIASWLLYLLALIITVAVEVPIVKRMETWNAQRLPPDWEASRDRWRRFHLVRVFGAMTAFALLAFALVW